MRKKPSKAKVRVFNIKRIKATLEKDLSQLEEEKAKTLYATLGNETSHLDNISSKNALTYFLTPQDDKENKSHFVVSLRDTNALKTLKEKLDREGASAIIGTEYSYTISDDKIYANKLNATEKYTGTSRNKIVSKAITEDLSDTPQGAELKILLGKDLCNVGYIIGKNKIVLYVKIPPQNLLQDTKTIREKDVTYTIFLSQQEKWVVVHITGLPLPVQPTEPNQSEPITQERNLLLPLNSTEHTHMKIPL